MLKNRVSHDRFTSSAYSAVKVFGPDGETLTGIISIETLRARKPGHPYLAAEVIRPKRDPIPSVPPLKTLVGSRRKREPA